MHRRRFLRTGLAASAVGLAGCPGGWGLSSRNGSAGDGKADPSGSPTRTSTPTPGGSRIPETTRRAVPDGRTGSDPPETTASGSSTPGPATGSSGLPRLRTDGEWIVTADGERFTPRGVNVVGPPYGDWFAEARGGDFMDTLELATDTDRGWYVNVIRLPILPERIDRFGRGGYADRFVDPAVDHCLANDTYLILDYHLRSDWQDEAVHDRVREFWDYFAPRYADEPHLLYEFWNEPERPADGTIHTWEDWKSVAQPLVDRIRADAPETPVVVGSPGWTSATRFAAESPFDGENLVYAGHVYPGDGESAATLDGAYGVPADFVPVILTEWGYDGLDDAQPGTTAGWGETFRSVVEERPNLGWLAWCFDSHWHPTMLDFDHEPTGGDLYHGWFVKEWLADARRNHVPDALATEGAPFEGPSDATPPDPPANPAVSDGSDGTERANGADGNPVLSWDQSTDAESRVLSYDVYVDGELHRRVDAFDLLNAIEAENPWDRTDLRFELPLVDIDNGSSHDLHLTAVDSLSNESEASPVIAYEG